MTNGPRLPDPTSGPVLRSVLVEVDTAFLEQLRSAALAGMPDEPVAFAYLFGSWATGGARSDGDADIAVLSAKRVVRRAACHPAEPGSEIVEPVARTEADVVLLEEAPLPLRGRILSQRQIRYSADEPLRVRGRA